MSAAGAACYFATRWLRVRRSPGSTTRHLHHFPGVVRHAGRTRAVASRGLFYEDEELAELVRRAGLADVVVVNDDGGQLLGARAQRPRPT